MKSLFKFALILVFCPAMFSFDIAAQEKPAETEVVKPVKKANQRPVVEPSKAEPFDKATVETMAKQCVKFETEAGTIEMEMFPESAPESVRSFLNLTATGAFDTTTFSRVVPDFIVQGGDLYTRREKMTAELGNRARKTLPDEPSQIKHERGILSMARADEPHSATTNFFILVGSAPHLDGTFAAFGRVTKGMETVDAINKMPVEGDKPKNPVR
ncbi:MAG: peptidylprolyl isomerase, partial [Acidobacteriota bacterium]